MRRNDGEHLAALVRYRSIGLQNNRLNKPNNNPNAKNNKDATHKDPLRGPIRLLIAATLPGSDDAH